MWSPSSWSCFRYSAWQALVGPGSGTGPVPGLTGHRGSSVAQPLPDSHDLTGAAPTLITGEVGDDLGDRIRVTGAVEGEGDRVDADSPVAQVGGQRSGQRVRV